ncbi:hypothetical protein BDW59DRAFT_158616 [Aspergillus cavernicola]|uniref:Stress-response A/B barrel domain-containing protein n=1 Tax=Aspergillus cavernicola TaxID=176166 RepID=A0ABR4IR87_9EURO
MSLIHIVLFSFKPSVSQAHKDAFVREVRKFKSLSCVKDGRLIVAGPSLTDSIALTQGFEFALVCYHEDLTALQEYQDSKEHHRVTSTYMFPFDQDLCRFDFEVESEDEYICGFPKARSWRNEYDLEYMKISCEDLTDELLRLSLPDIEITEKVMNPNR